jgi:putative hydroxymethylpyrimidine transport system substrate-binding protein
MKPPRIVALATSFAVVLLALTLAACGEKAEEGGGERESFHLTLDFYPNPDHAGIYMAQKLGYFEEAGLDVSIDAPSDPAAPMKLVAAGRSDLAISYEPEVILAHEADLDVVAIGALVNTPLTSMIWLPPSGINGVPSLKGKTIAYAGIPYQEAFLETILARGGLTTSDVKAVNVGFNLLPALVGGSAGAMLGGFQNVEGVDLRERGLKPVVTPVDQLGVPTYDELVLVANRETLEAEPEKFRLFLAAVERGTNAAVEQPNAATQAILDANPALEPKLTKAEVEATLPLLNPAVPPGQPFGFMNPDDWDTFAGWMRDNEQIETLPRASELLTNAYLPGEIPE